jgi:anthranilate synthase component 1
MEIIEEFEPVRRGPYAGAVGYFSFNGNADFAITIRTLVASGRRAYIQAGAGVVADSIPEREWFETEHKASALLKALQMASAGEEKP